MLTRIIFVRNVCLLRVFECEYSERIFSLNPLLALMLQIVGKVFIKIKIQ